ncbi:MAG TPA: hypothetical protein VJ810_19200 [Blastocatellia bacterium]|nr:hypothetical protein [Blastocatellia bacterium]
MKRINITQIRLAVICVLIASLFITLLLASGQERRKVQTKQEERSGEEKELIETEEQKAIRVRRQKLQLMVDQVITRLGQIEPAETKILAYIETAAALWKNDKSRAYRLIEQGIELLDGSYEKKVDRGLTMDLNAVKAEKQAREQFFRIIIRKIALLDASLAAKLEMDRREKKENAQPQYTEAAQAVMDRAVSLASEDPIRAAQIARDSMSQDQGIPHNTIRILFALNVKDKVVAQKLATDFIKRFETIPYSLVNLTYIAQYVFYKESTTEQLRDLYFNTYANRLRNDLLLDPPSEYLVKLRSSLLTQIRLAASYPKSQQQFEQFRIEVENYLPPRQPAATQGGGAAQVIDMTDLMPAKEGDAQSIKDAQARVAGLVDPSQRDKEYSRLAASAAQKADQSLAEDILGKIKDERIRGVASLGVYGPLVRKALEEKDWFRAQNLSTKVSDPLGRSFIMIDIANGMSAAKIEKDAIVRFYVGGLNQLQADPENLNVAKAYLALVNPILPIDQTMALAAARGAVRSFNGSKLPRPYSNDTVLPRAAAIWGQRLRGDLGGAQETFEPSDVLPRIFHALAVKEPLESQTLADQFTDRGLQTFAQLGIISMELAEQSKMQEQQKVKGDSPALSKPKEKQP